MITTLNKIKGIEEQEEEEREIKGPLEGCIFVYILWNVMVQNGRLGHVLHA